MPLDAAGIGQATALAQGNALKIIGGIPILKNFGGSSLEGLKIPKHLDAGNMGGLLGKVLAQGPQALLQNPIAGPQGQLASAVGGAVSQVTDALGPAAAPFTGALGNLQGSVGALANLAGNLSGVTNAGGLPNNFDLMGHIGLAQGFGDALPAGLGIETATAPLAMADDIAAMAARVTALAADVARGALSVARATSLVAEMGVKVDAAVSGATSAITTLQAAGPALMAAQVAVACLMPGTLPAAAAEAMRACIRPDLLDGVETLVADRVAEILRET